MLKHFLLQRNVRAFRTGLLLLNKDFYNELGVGRGASQDDIKQQYFKLAKQYHPDVNKTTQAKERFGHISNAYATLGDEQKRRIYDQTGLDGDEQTENGYGGNPSQGQGYAGFEGFQDQFKKRSGDDMFDEFEQSGQHRRGSVQTKGSDIAVTLEIEFMEAVLGAQKTVSFQRNDECSTCKGTRCRPGSGPTTCSQCRGSGYMNMRQGPFSSQETCGMCNGHGGIIRSPCVDCYGQGFFHNKAREDIKIPQGVDSGLNLRVAKKGNCGEEGGPAGDLIVNVKVKPHATFKRDGANIHSDCLITLSQAVLGSEVTVKTLYQDVKLKIQPGTGHNEKAKITNYGVQKLPPNQSQKGNHFVSFKIVVPKRMTPEQKRAMTAYERIEPKPHVYDNDL